MKIITTTGGFTGYKEFIDSQEGYEKAKIYLAKQLVRNSSNNWSIIRGNQIASENDQYITLGFTLLSSEWANDRKLMDQMINTEKRKELKQAVRGLS
jgi:hypothetical protein